MAPKTALDSPHPIRHPGAGCWEAREPRLDLAAASLAKAGIPAFAGMTGELQIPSPLSRWQIMSSWSSDANFSVRLPLPPPT